jgi:small-conductance mechanosensitive channel
MQSAWRLVTCLLAGTLAATAVLAADEPATAQQVARDSAPVVVANRRIILLHGISGYSARERATATMERIEHALAAENRPAVTTEEVPEGTRMLVGGAHAFFVTRADIDQEAGETTQIVARAAKERLEQAIGEHREQQTPRFLAVAAAFALAATLLYGAAVWLIVRVNGWVRRRLSRSAAAHSEKLRLGGLRIFDAAHVVVLTRRLFAVLAWLVALLLGSAWLSFVLERFPYTRPWGEQLSGHLLGLIGEMALAIVRAMPGLLLAVLIFVIARGIVRGIGIFFEQVVRGDRKVGWIDADTARPTRRILSFIVWVFALAIAYPYLPGAQTEAFKGLSVLLGLMISLGATSVIGQAFNGLILMYSRAYRAGDYVRIGDNEGTVESLGTFVTRIRTGLGEELTLPNSTVMTGSIKNYSRAGPGSGCVLDTGVTIGYSAPWRQVHAMLEEAARRTPGIAAAPAPFVRQTALSDYYVEYRLVAYTSLSEPLLRAEALSRLHATIQDVFNEHGVQILSPHYMIDPKEPQIVPKDRWYEPPAQRPEKS